MSYWMWFLDCRCWIGTFVTEKGTGGQPLRGKMGKRIILFALLFVFGNGNSFCQDNSTPANDLGIQYLGHVAVAVSDLGAALHFYCDQLGLTEVFRLNRPTGSGCWSTSESTITISLNFSLEPKRHLRGQRRGRAPIWAFM